MTTKILGPGEVKEAADIIKRGGLVAVPTETVYGLACSAYDAEAVRRVYETKGRPSEKPLSILVEGPEALGRYGAGVPEAALSLAEKYWPGPLTLVVPSGGKAPEAVRGGNGIGLRCPDHPLTLELLKTALLPLAAPSANPSGRPSPKTAREVLDYFDGRIDAVLDGGACAVGTESTVLDLASRPFRVLRQGALSEAELFSLIRSRLRVIGLTGGSGSGKSAALEAAGEVGGMLAVDCDRIYRELRSENTDMLSEIGARFPDAIEGGKLDMKRLGATVYADKDELLDLERITHRHILEEAERRLCDWSLSGGSSAVVEAIKLIESGFSDKCDVIVGIYAPRRERMGRIMARDGIDIGRAAMRIDAQEQDTYFLDRCGYVVTNTGDVKDFKARCRRLFEMLAQDDNLSE